MTRSLTTLLIALAILILPSSVIATHDARTRWKRSNIPVYDYTSFDQEQSVEKAVANWNEVMNGLNLIYHRNAVKACNQVDRKDFAIVVCSAPPGSGFAGASDPKKELGEQRILNAKVWLYTGESGNTDYKEEIATHEMGHAIGLQHYSWTDSNDDRLSIMHPFYAYAEARIYAHDIEALQAMGYGGCCLVHIEGGHPPKFSTSQID